jgi:Transposase DDE domain
LSRDGVPSHEGNTADPATVAAQITKLKQRFQLRHVVLVGDRGMLTTARIEQTLRPAGLDWITALRGPAIQQLAQAGLVQFSLFDTRDMAEISSPDYPGERLVVCKNPLLAEERRRKRDELRALTEADLGKIQTRVAREKNPLRRAGEIGKAVGAVMGKRKMAKHFALTITDDAFSFTRKTDAIAEEARLDGFDVLRTGLPVEVVDAVGTVRAYKSLAQVERAFRCIKTVDLELRPVFHWTAPRVRAHVLLCMLAYYLEWHMRQPLAPMLFDDHDRASAETGRTSPVAKAQVSKAAYRKASTQRIELGSGEIQPVHSFRTLLDDLATLTRNTVGFGEQKTLTIHATPTPVQRRALSLLGWNWPQRRQSAPEVWSRINGLRRKSGKVRVSHGIRRELLPQLAASPAPRREASASRAGVAVDCSPPGGRFQGRDLQLAGFHLGIFVPFQECPRASIADCRPSAALHLFNGCAARTDRPSDMFTPATENDSPPRSNDARCGLRVTRSHSQRIIYS